MSKFTENVYIAPLPKANRWITTAQLRYHVGSENSGEVIEVPVWFEFDGASVPMVFGWFIQRVEPKTISPACIHDWLYTEGRRYTQKKSDQIFYEALRASWVGRLKDYLMYIWVRLWGRIYRYKFI